MAQSPAAVEVDSTAKLDHEDADEIEDEDEQSITAQIAAAQALRPKLPR